jgi:hypothetical protein
MYNGNGDDDAVCHSIITERRGYGY